MNVIGDEFHLIMEGPAYLEERRQYIPLRFRQVKSTFNFCRLMSSNSRVVVSVGVEIIFVVLEDGTFVTSVSAGVTFRISRSSRTVKWLDVRAKGAFVELNSSFGKISSGN